MIKINELLNNYKISKLKSYNYDYLKSLHWIKGYNYKKFNKFNLINFRKNLLLSKGLDSNSNKVNHKVKQFYNDLNKKIDKKFIINNLDKTNVGNSNFLKKFNKSRYISFYRLHQIFILHTLINNINHKRIKTIVEIGGGYGSFGDTQLIEEN